MEKSQRLSKLILDWWEDAQHWQYSDEENGAVFGEDDTEPDFVKEAREIQSSERQPCANVNNCDFLYNWCQENGCVFFRPEKSGSE